MNTSTTDNATIAAVTTPNGVAGLAAVRVSGPDAWTIARRITSLSDEALRNEASHHARLTTVRRPDDATPVDQVLALPMHAPRSYTGEHSLEFFCHGGAQPAALVLEACLAAGARQAGPGEFTRRAFLNGRLSLDQAEGVADLIHAEDRLAARAALARLRGGLRDEVAAVEAPLLALLSRLEGSLEFTEDEGAELPRDDLSASLQQAARSLDDLLADADAGRRVRDGVRTVLAGPPNAGKSTLFNTLLGRERVLVDAEPGTTRDVVEAKLELDGLVFRLRDTAGLREDPGRVESAGIARAKEELAAADLVLWLVPMDGEPASLPEMPAGVVPLVLATRADLAPAAPAPAGALRISARTGEGLDALRESMARAVAAERMQEVATAGRALAQRHRERLDETRERLAELLALAQADAPDEVVATLLASALTCLGEVTGRVFNERLLGEVFSRFCVGK